MGIPPFRSRTSVSMATRGPDPLPVPSRLSRLLHKHMFEEAEKFALTFDLDVEVGFHSVHRLIVAE